MNKIRNTTILLFVFIAVLIGCGKNTNKDTVIALVNNDPIYEKDLVILEKITKIQYKGIENTGSSKEETLNKLIEKKMMLQESKKLNVSVSDKELNEQIKKISEHFFSEDYKDILKSDLVSYNDWKKYMQEQVIIEKTISQQTADMQISDKEISGYYYGNIKKYKHEEMVRAYQILVKTETEIKDIKNRLNNGENIEKLAKIKSISPEAEKGGDLGYFTREDMPPEIVDIVFKLPVGKISDIVKTNYGYHIFKVTDKKKKGVESLKDVTQDIKEILKLEKKEKYFKDWIKKLSKNAVIKINKDYLEAAK